MGVNPKPYSLNELYMMGTGKKRHDFDIAIALISYLNLSMAGEFDPKTANPYRQDLIQSKPEKNRQEDRNIGIAILRHGLKDIAEAVKRKKAKAQKKGE